MSYSYPFDISWTKEEIVDVVQFFTLLERAYESGVDRNVLLAGYRKFKQVVPSKSEEKKYFAEFERDSGYSGYHTLKKAKETQNATIKMI